jgi:uncharacterized protein
MPSSTDRDPAGQRVPRTDPQHRIERSPTSKPNRPRDPDAPPKPKRPRDQLGRPLPWDATNTLSLEDYDALPLERNHELGVEHFNAGRFFPAHEAWESAWKQAREKPETKGDVEFFKGLSQLGAGFTHLLRGNQHGAYTLLRRGAGRIETYGSNHRGLDAAALARSALKHAEDIEAAERAGLPSQPIRFPTV